MACLSYLAWTLWFLGYAGQALERSREALALAQELSHPVSLAFAQVFAAALHQLRGEIHLSQERAEAAISLSSEKGFQYWMTVGTLYRGWAVAERGQRNEGTLQIRHGLDTLGAIGANLGRPYFLARLAGAYEKGGQAEEGLAVLADALAILDESGERFYEAEIYRLKGDLTVAESRVQGQGLSVAGISQCTVQRSQVQSPTSQEEERAEANFLKAINIARTQQAKSLELRAATSLGRLWQRQDKKAEAYRMLAEIYGWFTEGFDTADLKEAKALLDELNRLDTYSRGFSTESTTTYGTSEPHGPRTPRQYLADCHSQGRPDIRQPRRRYITAKSFDKKHPTNS
jgi:predicted ATPase